MKKLKYVASLKSGESITSDEIADSGEYPVYGGNGLRGYTSKYTHSGHYVLIGRQGALCGNVNYASGRFWASEHAVVASIRDEVDVTWLGELLRAMDLNQYSQSAAQPGIAVDVIGNLELPVPPLDEQHAIAKFLSGETARIDTLVASKQYLLTLLAEKRKALITSAVSRGLDPNVPTKPSGISWLERVPAHWEVKRAKWLFRERDERTTTGEEVLLSLRMERGLVPHNDVSEKQTIPLELVGYKKVAPTQIVVNRMRAASGLVAIATRDGLVSPDYAVFQCAPDIDPDYYVHLFKTELLQAVFRSESTGLGTGSSGFLRLYSESFLSLWFPCPPLKEQRDIVKRISQEASELDSLRSATERSVSLLKERRTALIKAAVTGQIEVNATR
ncbi:MAG: restriction endonuclease subunit S [Acidobacteriia bacterium]|nr:restriction endonuclease subunit S [Terriglobia bacterium]